MVFHNEENGCHGVPVRPEGAGRGDPSPWSGDMGGLQAACPAHQGLVVNNARLAGRQMDSRKACSRHRRGHQAYRPPADWRGTARASRRASSRRSWKTRQDFRRRTARSCWKFCITQKLAGDHRRVLNTSVACAIWFSSSSRTISARPSPSVSSSITARRRRVHRAGEPLTGWREMDIRGIGFPTADAGTSSVLEKRAPCDSRRGTLYTLMKQTTTGTFHVPRRAFVNRPVPARHRGRVRRGEAVDCFACEERWCLRTRRFEIGTGIWFHHYENRRLPSLPGASAPPVRRGSGG